MIPICLFFGESERKKQKKWYKSLYERLRKKCSYSWWWFFSEKMRLFVQKKKHNCFLNDCIVRVSAGGGTNH